MQFPLNTHCRIVVAATLLAASLFAGSTARAQQVVVFVNGQPITNLDVDHRAKFIQMSTKKVPSRKEALDSLVDEALEIDEAKRFKIDIPDFGHRQLVRQCSDAYGDRYGEADAIAGSRRRER